MRIAVVVLLVLLLVPGWSGEEPRPVPGRTLHLVATPVALDPRDPRRVRVGALRFTGGVALVGDDPAFGGFSAIAVAGDRFTLLGDGGTVLRLAMRADWRPRVLGFTDLPGGPGTGWEKRDRDTESLAIDPATEQAWAGFERANAIWRYDAAFGRVERHVAPRAMRGWEDNGGAESLVRLRDGRFVTVAEDRLHRAPRGLRVGLVFGGDPTRRPTPALRFAYRPTPGFAVADMAEMPDGRLLVLERRFALPYRFANRLMIVARGAVRRDAVVRGRLLAALATPLVHDNFEGVAVVPDGDATTIWLVSDDNRSMLQRTLLLRFRLDANGPRIPRGTRGPS